jgi:hypothetical protein
MEESLFETCARVYPRGRWKYFNNIGESIESLIRFGETRGLAPADLSENTRLAPNVIDIMPGNRRDRK